MRNVCFLVSRLMCRKVVAAAYRREIFESRCGVQTESQLNWGI